MKKYIKYFIVFIIVFLILVLFGSDNTDNVWNYAMAHAIRIGEVPYTDFNIISTPLFPFIMSSLLFIYDSYGIYLLEQAILITLLFYFIYKIIDKKTYFLFAICSLWFFYFLFPSYNFLSILIIVIIIYLEINNKKNKYDKLIGLLLGLLIITKHSIGIVFLILSLISTKNLKRCINRFIYSIIPIGIFILYLLISGSFNNFIDLSILGIKDFNDNNHLYNNYFIDILLLGSFLYLIKSFIKYRKDNLNYYLIGSYIFIIPICDFLHFNYVLLIFLLVFLYRLDNKYNRYTILVSIPLIINSFVFGFYNNNFFNNYKFINNKHFDLYIVSNDVYEYINTIYKVYNKYDNSYIISMDGIYFDIASDKKINYLDIPLYGNFGHNGLDRIINNINNSHDTYYFIKDSDNRQFASEIIINIKNRGKYIDSIYDYDIYYFK